MAAEADVDALVGRGPRARHPRALRRRAAPRARAAPVLGRAQGRRAGSSDIDGSLRLRRGQLLLGDRRDVVLVHVVPARASTGRTTTWRATATSDVLWWLERFDGDGVRIDAVPMMPRAAIAAHRVGGARTRYDEPVAPHATSSARTTRGRATGRACSYYLGPHGLDSEFHFPLMWALRGRARATAGDAGRRRRRRSARAKRRGPARARSWASSSTTTTRRASRRVAAGDDDGGHVDAGAAVDGSRRRTRATQLALGAVFTLPGRAGPLLRRRGRRWRGQVGPRLAPRDAGRRAIWAPLQTQTRDVVQTLGSARACSEALRRGTYRTLHVDAERLVFAREIRAAEAAIVDLQRVADRPAVRHRCPGLPAGTWVDVLVGAQRVTQP